MSRTYKEMQAELTYESTIMNRGENLNQTPN